MPRVSYNLVVDFTGDCTNKEAKQWEDGDDDTMPNENKLIKLETVIQEWIEKNNMETDHFDISVGECEPPGED